MNMDVFSFKVTHYDMEVGMQKLEIESHDDHIKGITVKAKAVITAYGKEDSYQRSQAVRLVFTHQERFFDKVIPGLHYAHEEVVATIVRPFDQYEAVVDILRNEEPIYAKYVPGGLLLCTETGAYQSEGEPVGEGE